jgi:hypothetical protein
VVVQNLSCYLLWWSVGLVLCFAVVVETPIQLRGLTPVSFSGEVSVLFFSFAAFFRFALVYEWWWWCVGAGVFSGAVLCSWFAF